MEEDKIKTPSGEQIANVEKGKELLPGTNVQYSGKNVEQEGKHSLPARISDFLTGNMIATPQSVASKFNNQATIKDLFGGEDMEGSIDREGNLVKLSAMQNRVLFSLCKQIFSKERKEVSDYLEALKRGENPEKLPRVYILLPDMSGDIFGEEERGKPRKINEIYTELENISKVKVPQVYSTGTFKDEKGVEHSLTLRNLIPYISITGYEKQAIVDGNIYPAVQIECSRIFYERNWIGKGSRNFLLSNDILEARLPSGRKITTDVYWSGLFPMAANYSWFYYWHRLKAVEKKIKEEDIIDSVRIAQLKEDALTTPPIPFQRLRAAINFKSKHPQEEARFKKQLWEAMWALIERGVITDKSDIDYDNETFYFVFSESQEPLNKLGTKKEDEKRPGGKWTTYSPGIKPGPKKGSTKGRKKSTKNKPEPKKKSTEEEPELFPEKV